MVEARANAPRRTGQRCEPAILQIRSLFETRHSRFPPRSHIEQSTSFDAYLPRLRLRFSKIRFCSIYSGPQSRANPFRSPQRYLTVRWRRFFGATAADPSDRLPVGGAAMAVCAQAQNKRKITVQDAAQDDKEGKDNGQRD
jgi:hypothetical protein